MRTRTLLVVALCLALAAPRAWASSDDAGPWLRSLYDRPQVTNGDVLIAAALILEPKIWQPDAAWARKVAIAKGLMHEDIAKKLLPLASKRGFACSVFCRALDIDGGLMSRLTAQHPRWAYRELVALGMVPPGGDRIWISGDELAGLILAAERYREVGPERQPQRGEVP